MGNKWKEFGDRNPGLTRSLRPGNPSSLAGQLAVTHVAMPTFLKAMLYNYSSRFS